MEILSDIFFTNFLIKIVFVILTIMVFILGLFIFKQVLNMNSVIDFGSSSSMLKSVALLNMIVALCLILTALVIL